MVVRQPKHSLEPTVPSALVASRLFRFAGILVQEVGSANSAPRLSFSVQRLRSPPKKRERLPAERRGGIRFIVVGAMPLHYHRTKLSIIVSGDCRAARPASPPNQRMNPTLLLLNRQMAVGSERLKHPTVRTLDPQGRLSAAPSIDRIGEEAQVIPTTFAISLVITGVCAVMALLWAF